MKHTTDYYSWFTGYAGDKFCAWCCKRISEIDDFSKHIEMHEKGRK